MSSSLRKFPAVRLHDCSEKRCRTTEYNQAMEKNPKGLTPNKSSLVKEYDACAASKCSKELTAYVYDRIQRLEASAAKAPMQKAAARQLRKELKAGTLTPLRVYDLIRGL